MTRRFWFRPKRFGYGATPCTWEGWALTLATPLAIVASLMAMNAWVDRGDLVAWLVWAAAVATAIVALLSVSRARTDGEWRWRFGAGRDGKTRR